MQQQCGLLPQHFVHLIRLLRRTMDVRACVLYSGTFDRVDGHHNRVFAGIYHPSDPNLFITGGWDNTVHFWDARVHGSVRFVQL